MVSAAIQGPAPEVTRRIRSVDDLVEPFLRAAKAPHRWRIGIESEKFGVMTESLRPLAYHGDRGVEGVFARLCERFGWAARSEWPDGPVISLERGLGAITLEPGAQLELSGTPCASVHGVVREHEEHLAEIRAVGEELGLDWLAVGFHPFARQGDLPWVPKARYPIMREYLPRRGSRALDMMRRTATVQVCLDYADEGDAARKLALSLRLSPFVNAMVANAPFAEGAPIEGVRSERLAVWTDVDPDRTGVPPALLDPEGGFGPYVCWAVDVPMFLFKRNGSVIANTGQTFRSFLRDGFAGHRATMADWELHLSTLFPEVRLKGYLELRGADAVPRHLVGALAALWTGLLYDPQSIAAAESACANYDASELQRLRTESARAGLGASFRGVPVRSMADQLIEWAWEGLRRRAVLDEEGRDETHHLVPLVELVQHGQTPADRLLEGLSEVPDAASRKLLIRERVRI